MEAMGFVCQIDLQFTGLLVTFCKVRGNAKYLSDVLQLSALDLARAVDLLRCSYRHFPRLQN